MKSIDNLLLLGDGKSWSRQSVDFAGLPEMARTFYRWRRGRRTRVPCRCIGMGPELDLRLQLERLDRLICWSEDVDEGALSFAFRPLWQLDEPAKAALALSKAQATQVYAGLKLWPDAMMARLAEAQLVADGTYPPTPTPCSETPQATPVRIFRILLQYAPTLILTSLEIPIGYGIELGRAHQQYQNQDQNPLRQG